MTAEQIEAEYVTTAARVQELAAARDRAQEALTAAQRAYAQACSDLAEQRELLHAQSAAIIAERRREAEGADG